jgi:hypothetical protein
MADADWAVCLGQPPPGEQPSQGRLSAANCCSPDQQQRDGADCAQAPNMGLSATQETAPRAGSRASCGFHKFQLAQDSRKVRRFKTNGTRT